MALTYASNPGPRVSATGARTRNRATRLFPASRPLASFDSLGTNGACDPQSSSRSVL